MDVDHIIEAQANATLDDAINEAHKDTQMPSPAATQVSSLSIMQEPSPNVDAKVKVENEVELEVIEYE